MFVKKLPTTQPVARCEIWKRVMLGTGLRDGHAFRNAILKSNQYRISPDAGDGLHHPSFVVAPEEVLIDLVRPSLCELGFKQGAVFADIIARALNLGLQLCPIEVGPQLRLQYRNQPKTEDLRIAMMPIVVNGHPAIFTVQRNFSWFLLGTDAGHEKSSYGADCRFVFVKPRKEE